MLSEQRVTAQGATQSESESGSSSSLAVFFQSRFSLPFQAWRKQHSRPKRHLGASRPMALRAQSLHSSEALLPALAFLCAAFFGLAFLAVLAFALPALPLAFLPAARFLPARLALPEEDFLRLRRGSSSLSSSSSPVYRAARMSGRTDRAASALWGEAHRRCPSQRSRYRRSGPSGRTARPDDEGRARARRS